MNTPKYVKFKGAVYRIASTLVHEAWGARDENNPLCSARGYVVSYDPEYGDPVSQAMQGNKSRREDELIGKFESEAEAKDAVLKWEAHYEKLCNEDQEAHFYRLADDTNPTANDSFDEAVKKRNELEYQYRNIVHWLRLHSSDSDDAYNEAEKKAKYIYTALEHVQSEIEKYLLPNPFRNRRDFLRSPRSR